MSTHERAKQNNPSPTPPSKRPKQGKGQEKAHIDQHPLSSLTGLTPDTVLQLQRTVGNRAVGQLIAQHQTASSQTHIQRRPQRRPNSRWIDTAADGREYVSLSALVQANQAHYQALEGDPLREFLQILKENLRPPELRALLGDAAFKSKVVGLQTQVNVRVIRFPGIRQTRVDTALRDAGRILGAYGLRINVVSTLAETEENVRAGIRGVDRRGRRARDTSAQDSWSFIGRYQDGNTLPIVFLSDFTGHDFMNKPSGITSTIDIPEDNERRIMVMMRAGQGGQTLAHEIGHALGAGSTPGSIDHGEHVNARTEWNLMHGDPIIGRRHTSLRREQVAAFKGSPFVTTVEEVEE